MNILEELAESNRELVNFTKEILPFSHYKNMVETTDFNTPSFKEALMAPGMSFICELKKASPSKGLICPDFDDNYLEFAREYQDNGAAAISCLTEPKKFKGSLKILDNVVSNTDLPVLRKDFIIDTLQIYEAASFRASAVLLIVSLLSERKLKKFLKLSGKLRMDALVEVHSKEEIEKALNAGADIIGINNRNLKDFSVDLKTSEALIKYIPDSVIRISESGIHTPEDVAYLQNLGFDGVLVGEQLMSSGNIPRALKELKSYEN